MWIKWHRVDKSRLIVPIWTHTMLVYFLYTFQWWYLVPFVIINYAMNTTLSIFLHKTLAHRHWSYNSKILDHIFAFITSINFFGGPIQWAIMHRLHHKYTDEFEDPHAPQIVGHIISHLHLWKVPPIDIKKKIKVRDLFRDYKHLIVYFKYPNLSSFLAWAVVGILFGLEGMAIVGAASCWQLHTLGIVDNWVHRKGNGIIINPARWFTAVIMGSPEAIEHKEHHEKPWVYTHIDGWFDYHARIMEILAKYRLVKINVVK
jgi:fatty-acid desaturase